MRKSALKMDGSVTSSIEFPNYLHSAIICGKTEYVLDLFLNEYKGVFENVVIL